MDPWTLDPSKSRNGQIRGLGFGPKIPHFGHVGDHFGGVEKAMIHPYLLNWGLGVFACPFGQVISTAPVAGGRTICE